MDRPGIVVSALAVSPVKGLRLQPRTRLMLDSAGVREDRRFFLVDERNRMVNGKQLGELSSVASEYCERDRGLKLTFPNGVSVAGEVELGDPIAVTFYRHPRTAFPVLGPFSEALSAHVGRPVRLVEAEGERGAVDRAAGSVSLISRASLAELARVGGEDEVDARRFRMLVEIEGVAAHEEDRWIKRRLRVGAALVGFTGHVGRCIITSRDPDTGVVDLPTLDLLRSYRASANTTEPLAFGVWGEVLEPGLVRVGDPVRVS